MAEKKGSKRCCRRQLRNKKSKGMPIGPFGTLLCDGPLDCVPRLHSDIDDYHERGKDTFLDRATCTMRSHAWPHCTQGMRWVTGEQKETRTFTEQRTPGMKETPCVSSSQTALNPCVLKPSGISLWMNSTPVKCKKAISTVPSKIRPFFILQKIRFLSPKYLAFLHPSEKSIFSASENSAAFRPPRPAYSLKKIQHHPLSKSGKFVFSEIQHFSLQKSAIRFLKI